MAEWTNRKVLDFIENYRKLPVLWNTSLASYKSYQLKLDAHAELAENFRCDIPFVRRKIQNLRRAFVREQQLLTGQKLGTLPSKKTKWFAYDRMSFLIPFAGRRSGFYADVLNITDALEESVQDEQDLPSIITQEIELEQQPCSSGTTSSMEDARVEEAYSILKASTQEDECSIYCKHLANQLRSMSISRRLITQNKIDNILFEARMEEVQEQEACNHILPVEFR